jgi:2-polyprenyl-3-methyl-5-hydroxy-6-metoxy-1,4-benzoquinol methylase
VRNRLINTKPKEFEYYNGIQIHADTGVHEQAAELIKKYFPAGTTVLDVGAGAGAFSQRLADLGYSVTALDVDPQKWIPKDIPFLVLDIDKGIKASVANTYDSVCCLEVIEHVENPWNLLREIYSVTKPGGYLLLSTPNITSFLSRALFFLTGRFHQFNDGDLSYGHINPVSAFELEHAATQVGWQLIDIQPGGYLPVFDLVALRPFLWTAVFNALCGLGFVIGKGYKEGWCLFYVLRKPAAAS